VTRAVTRLAWTGEGWAPGVPGCVRIVDSWLVTDGRGRAVDAHLRRFARACASLYGVRAGEFACAALARIPARGRWFPRLELAVTDAGGAVLSLWLRPAPPLGGTVRLWLPPEPDQRVLPRVKGPDLPYLTRLREAAADDEPLLVSAEGHVLEGATTSVLWWRGNTLCAPPAELVLPSVTRTLLLDAATARGIPVRIDLATPAELRPLRVWAVNALHGVRLAQPPPPGHRDARGWPCHPREPVR
jgi:branched-subunit amino acid aminotransferase/4-amino-4-deoxychorismate lyase